MSAATSATTAMTAGSALPPPPADGGAEEREAVTAQGAAIMADRVDQRRKAQNEQDIGDIGSDHVADREPRHPRERGIDADEKLGRGCSERDDGQPDEGG